MKPLLALALALAAFAPSVSAHAQTDGIESEAPPILSDRPLVPSFQRRSGTRAGGPANELNTGDARATETLPDGEAAIVLQGGIFHGNYCGKGHRGGTSPVPVDELDAACMRHDHCYDAAKGPSCACDRTLQREATRVADLSRLSRELRRRAALVAEAATAMPCRTP